MRSLSSIIKGERVRKQTVINLSERLDITAIEYAAPEYTGDEFEEAEIEQEYPIEPTKHLEDARLQAEAILKEASEKAEELLVNTREEARAIKAAAEVEKNNLLCGAMEKQAALIEQTEREARTIIEEAYNEKERIIRGTEGEMVETLITLLQYLIGEEVYHHTAWIRCIVKKMLANPAFKKDIKVYLSANVYHRLTDEDKEVIMHMRDHTTIHIADSLSDTACRVETEEGAVEYDISSGLERVIADIKIIQNLD